MSMEVVRIATRESALALWQANFIRDRLMAAHPGLEVELLGMTTAGDRWLQTPLSEIGGKGLFVKELEQAMLDGRADIAVHSVKDLPAELPDGFDLPVVAFRDAVHDVVVGAAPDLDAVPQGARIGSSSLRRQAQLKAIRPDLDVKPIRGNVGTRLGKLEAGEYDAIVLAAAGLNRLGLSPAKSFVLPVTTCLPAPGQGALGIECLADSPVRELLAPLADAEVAACVAAERGISAGLGADCSLPVAASAVYDDGVVALNALLADADGGRVLRAHGRGSDPAEVARHAVQDLFDQGAQAVLDDLAASGHD